MKVEVKFKLLNPLKKIMLDSSDIEIEAKEIRIKSVNINFFTKDDINLLANSNEVSIKLFNGGDGVMLEINMNKAFCSVEFMPSEEDRVKYLTNEIEKLSSELNKIINK